MFEYRRDLRPGEIPDVGDLARGRQQPGIVAEKGHRSHILIETQARGRRIRPFGVQVPHRRSAIPGADRNPVGARAESDIPYPVSEVGGSGLVARGTDRLAQRILGLGGCGQKESARLVGCRNGNIQGSRRVRLRDRGDAGGARVCLGTVMLGEGIQPAGNGNQRKGRGNDQQAPLPTAASLLLLLPAGRLALLLLHVTVAPVDQRRSEHVVIDLVIRCLGTVDRRRRRAQDALFRQGAENPRHVLAERAGPAHEVVTSAGDLAPARRDEAIEEGGADGLAGLVEVRHHCPEMAANDFLRPAEAIERYPAQDPGLPGHLLLPQAGQHQLQEGRFDQPVLIPQ